MPDLEIKVDYIVEFKGSDFNGWTAISAFGRLFFLKDILGKWIEVKTPLDPNNIVRTKDSPMPSQGVVKVETPQKRKQRLDREIEYRLWYANREKDAK